MRVEAVISLVRDLDAIELSRWIECRWVRPAVEADGWRFDAIDLARIRLIHDLRRQLDVTEDLVPMVLSLIDQVYDLRSSISGMMRAIEAQPAAIQNDILAALTRGPNGAG